MLVLSTCLSEDDEGSETGVDGADLAIASEEDCARMAELEVRILPTLGTEEGKETDNAYGWVDLAIASGTF